MKNYINKILLSFIILGIAAYSSAQTKADLAGMWKIIGQPSGVPGTTIITTYLSLNADGSYIFGIDSAKSNPLETIGIGKWDITSAGEVKLIPDNKADAPRYYVPEADNIYEYKFFDKEGKKTPVIMLEQSFFIQKINK